MVQSLPQIGCPETVCDPFCGDGRLIVAWIRHQARIGSLSRLKKVSLWDYDGSAVSIATEAVSKALSNLGVNWVTVNSAVGDTFSRTIEHRFELVITNPPWEQLKPDSRDGVKDTARYRTELQAYGSELTRLFPDAAASRRKTIGGYTVNLARAGALAAINLTAENGLLLIVLPSTIFADQVSSSFRRRFFSDLSVQEITFYPAEAKLFAGVDQSFVTVSGRAGHATSSFCLRQMNSDISVLEARQHVQPSYEAPLPLAIGGAQHALISEIQSRHPKLAWLESDLRYGLRLGRELDETRIAETFSDTDYGTPFIKGRDIQRFNFEPRNLPKIDPRKRKIPSTTSERRISWRDVSRPSQKRRIHACIIPSGYVTGNSIGIARFSAPSPYLLETLLAVMNSLVFEVQVRGALATNHVSQGVIRSSAVPYSLFENANMRAIIGKTINGDFPTPANETRLEIMIAKAYGLSRDDLAVLLRSFNKLSMDEIEDLVSRDAWL